MSLRGRSLPACTCSKPGKQSPVNRDSPIEKNYPFKRGLLLFGLDKQRTLLDQGTLYPLLRRLKAQGLLQAVWKIEEARPRRYYVISAEGRKLLPKLKKEWAGIVSVMEKMLA